MPKDQTDWILRKAIMEKLERELTNTEFLYYAWMLSGMSEGTRDSLFASKRTIDRTKRGLREKGLL